MTDQSYAFASALPDPERRPDFYAGVPGRRLLAWIGDGVATFLLTCLALPFTAFVGVFFFGALWLTVSFLYRWGTIAAFSATPGMAFWGIQLREADGGKMGGGSAFLHTLGYTVSVAMAPLQLISVALMLITDRRQGLTDHLLGTAAINRPV
ncbi:RDD family protein [Pseudoroseicyclus tamaricis]|uniref:RDD family protein n=1 Tax=Pseudoroseicyclus tamaricis TaxID=2705421 RepID=A0A6B2JQA6_9RHOB|nr:RDD family protein [Pseudoroseicyclus tamaricis]NDV00867.1 RDD family protein [Pseudoroseicyclus tamaricis]